MSENNVKNTDKGKAYYDFFRLASASNDYTEDELEEFKYFVKSAFRIVNPDQELLVRNALNPKRSNVRILGEGLHVLNPILEESIKIPNPANPIVINYKPKDDADRQDNFTFIPDLVSGGEQSEKDEIYCDYKVSVRIVDPIQYFYSSNVLENLRADIVGVLREFVASKSKKEIMTHFNQFSINEIDPHGKLHEYRRRCGLDVIAIGFDSVKESKAVQEARNRVAVERQNIEKEKAIAERKKQEALGNKRVKEIETEADVMRYQSIATSLRNEGLSSEDISFLLGVSIRGDAIRALRDSDKANVFVNMGESMMGMNPMMYFARHGENTRLTNQFIEDANVIDAEAVELDENGSTKKRRR